MSNGILPTFKRYKSLFLNGKRNSITRSLQYEMLAQKKFIGKTLDFGGGDKAKYGSILNVEDYDSINIDPKMNPTWVTKVGEFPCEENIYDNVISLNTFEHIYDVKPIIEDIYRTLKLGGEFTCALPFLVPIHAHPDDFFRPTSSWWQNTLDDAGFHDIRITPLLWGPFSTGFVCSGSIGPFITIRQHLNLILDLLYIKSRFRNGETAFDGALGKQLQSYVLGYFIEARK